MIAEKYLSQIKVGTILVRKDDNHSYHYEVIKILLTEIIVSPTVLKQADVYFDNKRIESMQRTVTYDQLTKGDWFFAE